MRYGFCLNFASACSTGVDFGVLERIRAAKFDEAELPLSRMVRLSSVELDELTHHLRELGLLSSACTNFFPDEIGLYKLEVENCSFLEDYLSRATDCALRLGVQKIIFASIPDWQIPPGRTREEGFRRLTHLLSTILVPRFSPLGIQILVEPLRRSICNLVNTLEDGMELVQRVASPHVQLAADTYHMLCNDEEPRNITRFASAIGHVHVVEPGRVLPAEGWSHGLEAILQQLKLAKYDGSFSFETAEGNDVGRMKAALLRLRTFFEPE